jgi:hypothetical protein
MEKQPELRKGFRRNFERFIILQKPRSLHLPQDVDLLTRSTKEGTTPVLDDEWRSRVMFMKMYITSPKLESEAVGNLLILEHKRLASIAEATGNDCRISLQVKVVADLSSLLLRRILSHDAARSRGRIIIRPFALTHRV